MRLINGDELREEIMREDYDNDTINNFLDLVDLSPTIEAEPVVHGHWVKHKPNPEAMRDFHEKGIGTAMGENSIYWTCSVCEKWGTPHNKYCPNCGAKMDEKEQK